MTLWRTWEPIVLKYKYHRSQHPSASAMEPPWVATFFHHAKLSPLIQKDVSCSFGKSPLALIDSLLLHMPSTAFNSCMKISCYLENLYWVIAVWLTSWVECGLLLKGLCVGPLVIMWWCSGGTWCDMARTLEMLPLEQVKVGLIGFCFWDSG